MSRGSTQRLRNEADAIRWGCGGNKAGEKKLYSSIPLRKKEVLVNVMNLKLNFDINLEPRNEQLGVFKVSYS